MSYFEEMKSVVWSGV